MLFLLLEIRLYDFVAFFLININLYTHVGIPPTLYVAVQPLDRHSPILWRLVL